MRLTQFLQFKKNYNVVRSLKTINSKNILLHALDYPKINREPPFSLATASILANMKSMDLNIQAKTWAVNDTNYSYEQVVDDILNKSTPSTDIALGVYVWNDKSVADICRSLREKGHNGLIILGGPQITYTKSGLENLYPHANVFIRGYAEDALIQLYTNEFNQPIRGIHYANQPDLSLQTTSELDNLISPFLSGIIKPQHFIRWETQRGCSFNCSFCQYKEVEKLKRRYLNKDRVIKEAQWIASHKIIRDVHVVDAVFNSGPNYINILKTLSKGSYNGKISLQTRIEMITDEFIAAVHNLNKTGMVVLECGLQTSNLEEQKYIERPTNIRRIKSQIEKVLKYGIEVEISLIFGLPGQTLDSFKKSIEFCRQLGVTVIQAFPLTLYRGTQLWHKRKELGLISALEVVHNNVNRIQEEMDYVIESPSFSYYDWQEMVKIADHLSNINQIYIKNRDKQYTIENHLTNNHKLQLCF
ncbi:MAG: B12-binding domain-containing radical SAM protein [Gammaproteobacteria bacterium]